MSARRSELRVDGVSVVYPNGHVAVQEATFSLQGGTICALVGVNGSGKSSLFKSIMGFVRPTAGTITVDGLPIGRAQKANLMAYVPQAEEVDWNFPVSVWDVVMMGRYGKMGFLRIPRSADRAAVEASLARVEMSAFAQRQIGELSGGQKKRVFLARALAQEAPLVLLDEPFTGVDVKTEGAIIELLKNLRDLGHVILVSTHNLGSVPEYCDQAVILKKTVLASGPLATSFTEENLSRAFGGALRHFRFDESTVGPHDGRTITVLTDEERPVVYGKGGHLEFTRRQEHEKLVKEREQADGKKAPTEGGDSP